MGKSVFQGEFDQLDKAILEALQINGRISVADLARAIHLSPPAVYQRIKRLERAGLIRGYVALVDREAAGLDVMCFIRLTIQPHTHEQIEKLQNALNEWPEVLECHRMAAGYDFLLRVVTYGHNALDRVIHDRLMHLPGAQKIETSSVLREMKSTTALTLD